MISKAATADVCIYITGDSQEQLLLTAARDFMWG